MSANQGLRTIDELDVEGRRILLRADLDVPLTPASEGVLAGVADDARIRAALPTVDELRRRGARLIICAHLGRPSGRDPGLSMQPVAARLEKLTGARVQATPAVIGPRVRELTNRLRDGEMLMLENVRFEPGETRNDPATASALAELADLYVDDDFASAHRRQASTCGVAQRLPSAAGRLMEREVHALDAIVERPARPLVAVLGGARLDEKIDLVRRFLELADTVCIGGALAFPFLAALGHSVGESPCPPEDVERARLAMVAAAGLPHRLALPKDLMLGSGAEDEEGLWLDGLDVPDGWTALDIGTTTAEHYGAVVAEAGTVFWNGPMGRFELRQFAEGTHSLAAAVASTPATTVAAGGETLRALEVFGLEGRISHLSSGGQATLEFLEGRELPGVRVLLRDAPADVQRDPHAGRRSVNGRSQPTRRAAGRGEALPSSPRASR